LADSVLVCVEVIVPPPSETCVGLANATPLNVVPNATAIAVAKMLLFIDVAPVSTVQGHCTIAAPVLRGTRRVPVPTHVR
jgi:hypothetical protein